MNNKNFGTRPENRHTFRGRSLKSTYCILKRENILIRNKGPDIFHLEMDELLLFAIFSMAEAKKPTLFQNNWFSERGP